MALARPLVTVYAQETGAPAKEECILPVVFEAPIRPDLVNFVYDQMSKNKRQPYAVSPNAGYQTSAESWGTGRAVARIPRVPGGGTHRAGQGAFGNMCRGGGMFAPTKIWRRWHRHINRTQRRHAAASAVAATGVPSLVMARGHRIDQVAELPLVVSNEMEAMTRTANAKTLLKKLGLGDELMKVTDSRHIRAGKGKRRNRRCVQAKGPLVVYESDNGITRAFRNIPGVELCCVKRLNLLKLAPGGHLGRLVIWTKGAFEYLEGLFGDYTNGAPKKTGYTMPRPLLTNPDISRLINSDEVQSVINPMKDNVSLAPPAYYNPLSNHRVMVKMNPAAAKLKRFARRSAIPGTAEHKVVQKRKAEALEGNMKRQKRAPLERKLQTDPFDEKHKADALANAARKEAARKAIQAAQYIEGTAASDDEDAEDDDEEE